MVAGFCYSFQTWIYSIIVVIFNLFVTFNNGAGTATITMPASRATLLFTTYHDIRLANLSRFPGPPSVEILVKDLSEGAALDFFYEKQLVCWTDQGLVSIQCMKINETYIGTKNSVISTGLDKPEGLAIDWYTDKIYWTDGETNRIEVTTLNGNYQKVLFWMDLDQPRAIALVPSKKLMIWSDWGENPKIERASMDGDATTRKILVTDKIFWPNGLTVDLENNLIYWVDGHLQFLDVMNLDGSNRRTVIKDVAYPYSVTLLQNLLFWTDWTAGSIHTYDLVTNETKELIDTPEVPIAVHAWDHRLQPSGDNPCKYNNGNCSHLCLLSTNSAGYSCACPTGIKLLTSNRCADGPLDMLFLVQRTQISRISLDSPDHTSIPLKLDKVKYAIAIDYDPVDDFIYWSDEKAHAIRRARQDGSAQTDIITLEVVHPDGIAIDWLARNLYWTDNWTDRIEVCRLDGSSRKAIVNEYLEEPRAIALAPSLGWMFWSDWNEKNPKVERASLDGSDRIVLVSDGLGWPNGIAVDIQPKKIYWCDAKTDKIEVAQMDGSDRRVVLNENLPHVFGLSLLGDFLYWTDWQRRSIDRAHKITGTDRLVIVDQFPELMGLKVARLKEITGTSPCTNKNGGCSHLCLNRPNDYVCRCPIDFELGKDQKTCLIPSAFLLFAKQDIIGRISIEYNEGYHNDYIIPFKELRDTHMILIDVDIADKRLYFADQKSKSISRAFINGSDVQKIIDSGISVADGLAVDWLAHNIYWADSETRRIEVARLDGSSRKVLLFKGLEEPRSLVLEPRKGYMYWSEWPSDSIRRALLDGTELVTIISAANRAIGLTQDVETRRLYWASLNHPTSIEAADWDGRNRQVLVQMDVEKPFAVTLYKDYLYWSDWNSGNIEKLNKMTGDNRSLVHSDLKYVSTLLTFHSSRQFGTNQCRVNNGGCSHLCLALPNRRGVTCGCPTHFTLAKDNISCIPPKNYLLFSTKTSFGRLLPDTLDAPDAPLPVTGKNIKGVEYDPLNNVIYWIEGKGQSIRKSFENGTRISTFINAGSQPFDIAIDIIGRLLFWTCSRANTINVTSLDGYTIGNINTTDLEKPRSIAVHPLKRLLFWTDVGTQQAVFRARIDGANRVLLRSKLDGVTAIAVDPIMDLVFFAYGTRIDVIDIHGNNNLTLISRHINQVISLAVLQGYLYWLDDKTGLERISIAGGDRKVENQKLTKISDITAVYTFDQRLIKNHTCMLAKQKCSHFCIAVDSTVKDVTKNNDDDDDDDDTDLRDSIKTCSCPYGLMLLDDKINCGALPACGPDHFTCTALFSTGIGNNYKNNGRNLLDGGGISGVGADGNNDLNKDCIPVSWRCDGQNDCPDKSDEVGCPRCRSDEFRCQSGECIDKLLVCDGITNCADGHDEADCCKNPQDFQCPINKVCISPTFLCDGWDNCADGADEALELCNQVTNRRISPTSDKRTFIIITIVVVVLAFAIAYFWQICKTKLANVTGIGSRGGVGVGGDHTKDDQSADPLSPSSGPHHYHHHNHNYQYSATSAAHKAIRVGKIGISVATDAVRMSTLNSRANTTDSYDRNNITGASSSTTTHTGSFIGYPINPPPSPATTTTSTRCNSYRPYRHYKVINQPPPPTPCSTDVCDESDSNYTSHKSISGGGSGTGCGITTANSNDGKDNNKTRAYRCYEREPYPPPPTPGSYYHSDFGGGGCGVGGSGGGIAADDSCPPSPSSRSSTYFSPLPPPPSPVPIPSRGFS